MIEEIVKEKLNEKVWSFDEITKVDRLVVDLQSIVYDELTPKEKLDLIWDETVDYERLIGPATTARNVKFGELFQAMMKDRLHKHIAVAIKNELSNATINFKVNKNEVSKGSLGGEPHKKRPSDEKNNS